MTTIERGSLFRLASQATVFRATRAYMAAGFIPSVHGVTLDGKRQTCARIADIIEVEPQPGSALSAAMRAADMPAMDYLRARFPRLTRAMKWAAILCDTEAGAALRDYVLARDGIYDRDLLRYGGGEAVCHFGGPVAVIAAAIRWRAIVRRLSA